VRSCGSRLWRMGYHTGSSSESSSYPIPTAVIRGKKRYSITISSSSFRRRNTLAGFHQRYLRRLLSKFRWTQSREASLPKLLGCWL